jgi:hypothetical protein
MDHDIALIIDPHPSLERFLRINTRSGCLEYFGPLRGRSLGNPLMLSHSHEKKSSILLRRWVWQQHHGPLLSKQFVFMNCKNFRCHAIAHMKVVTRYQPYRNNPRLSTDVFNRSTILIVRFFKDAIPKNALARWFQMSVPDIRAIWDNRIFPEYQLTTKYMPNQRWIHRAEQFSANSLSGHYLGPNNRKIALRDIEASNLSKLAKKRLQLYIQGEDYVGIAKLSFRDYSSVRESIQNGLLRLSHEYGPREWLSLLMKRPHHV